MPFSGAPRRTEAAPQLVPVAIFHGVRETAAQMAREVAYLEKALAPHPVVTESARACSYNLS